MHFLGRIDYGVLIPTLNEAMSISSVLARIEKKARIIVIDGGSSDGTAQIARRMGATVLSCERKGNGAAFKAGLAKTNAKYVASIDGDGTYDPSEIAMLVSLAKSKNADAVFGSRLSSNGNRMRLARKIGNLLVSRFISFLFGIGLEDSQSGLCVFKREELARRMPLSDGMPHCQEMKIRFLVGRKKCLSMPISYTDRPHGSKFNFFIDGFGLVFHALKLKFLLSTRKTL